MESVLLEGISQVKFRLTNQPNRHLAKLDLWEVCEPAPIQDYLVIAHTEKHARELVEQMTSRPTGRLYRKCEDYCTVIYLSNRSSTVLSKRNILNLVTCPAVVAIWTTQKWNMSDLLEGRYNEVYANK